MLTVLSGCPVTVALISVAKFFTTISVSDNAQLTALKHKTHNGTETQDKIDGTETRGIIAPKHKTRSTKDMKDMIDDTETRGT